MRTVFFLLLGYALLFSQTLNVFAQKPNVLIFMSDDIGYGDIQAFNPQNTHTPTPHIDKLAATGVSFLHAHSPAATCAPTRYALISGNHVYRGRLFNGTWGLMNPSQITPGQETLGDRLNKNGYRTAFFGKIHLGGLFQTALGKIAANYNEADLTKKFTDGPLDHGYDYSLGLPSGIQKSPLAFFKNDRLARYDSASGKFEYLTAQKIKQHFLKITDLSAKEKWTTEVPSTRPLYVMDNYNTETVGPLLTQDALRFLDSHFKDNPEKPFYMHYMSPAGHRTYAPPFAFNVSDPYNTNDASASGAIRVKGMTPNKRTDMIYETDIAMRLLVEKLKELGQLQNTIIIYTSDNGAEISENASWKNPIYTNKDGHPWYKGPYGGDRIEKHDYPEKKGEQHANGQGIGQDGKALRGMKQYVYEGGHRVPLILRWGGGKAANSIIQPGAQVTDQVISLTDLYRTICTLAGVKVPDNQAVDSYDFSQVLTDPKPVSKTNPPVRDFMAIQSTLMADSAVHDKVKPRGKARMSWSFYSYDSDHRIWNAIIGKSRTADDYSSVNGDELYLLSNDEDQSENIKDANKALLNTLTQEFISFHKKTRTHKGQLETPERAKEWKSHTSSTLIP